MNESSAGQEAERGIPSGGIIVGPGQGRTVQGTGDVTLIATAEETGGSIGVFEGISPPGDGPPRHIHYGSDEMFHILEGEFLFLVGDRQESVSAGTYVFVPRGTIHAYKAVGTERGRLLMALIPGGPERLAEEFVKLSTEGEGVNRSTVQQNEMFAELNEKYDTEFVGPPL